MIMAEERAEKRVITGTINLNEINSPLDKNNTLNVEILDEEVNNAMEMLYKSTIMKKKAEEIEKSAKLILEQKLTSKNVISGFSNDWVIHICQYEQQRFDSKSFKEKNPEIYSLYSKSIKSVRYTVDPNKHIEITDL